MTAIIVVSSYISIPFTIPFTLQLLGIFLSLLILDGLDGLLSISLYILLGVIGIPVFSSFSGGIDSLLGPTGGFIFGFLFIGISYYLFTLKGQKLVFKLVGLIIGLLICYLFGTLWFTNYINNTITIELFISSLIVTVLPYIVFDLIKLGLALLISDRIKKIIELKENK